LAAGIMVSARPKRARGNPGYAGYEYQIDVTMWVALDLIIAKEATRMMVIEPPSDEDIEAAVTNSDSAALGLSTGRNHYALILQIKSRSTEPWTTAALAPILLGEGKSSVGSKARQRPLSTLAADAQRRYVFVTNESLAGPLRPYSGEHLLDFPDVKTLPPHARQGYNAAQQALIAPRIALCAGFTTERLHHLIARLLTEHGHVPSNNHKACIADLADAVRMRMRGHIKGQLTQADLVQILTRHGGSVLPTRAMDHYVRPRSYEAIRSALAKQHAVVIAGPSGTGKTLTADILEQELRKADPPYTSLVRSMAPVTFGATYLGAKHCYSTSAILGVEIGSCPAPIDGATSFRNCYAKQVQDGSSLSHRVRTCCRTRAAH
jgi:hypothetical protein